MDAEEFDRRLHAHREILITVLAGLARMGHVDLLERLIPETVFMNGEEDPGVLPTVAFGLEQARAEEIRSIVDAARLRSQQP